MRGRRLGWRTRVYIGAFMSHFIECLTIVIFAAQSRHRQDFSSSNLHVACLMICSHVAPSKGTPLNDNVVALTWTPLLAPDGLKRHRESQVIIKAWSATKNFDLA
ncbi:hypothetical protein C8R47DRAFT_788805 [Mycena vitilis]|nr:hypothetical protein C8R47DRAFT_788805 [Mycena vitilis]